jgi:thiosulfate dehydrogenase (quinone) large subunit
MGKSRLIKKAEYYMAKKDNNQVPVATWYALAVTRILLGFLFLWAFLDKLLGLGFSTPTAKAWVNGGSPTSGFLKGVDGPFADLFNVMAGIPLIDYLFMAGLLGLGVALVLGVGVKIAAVAGSVLLLMMWLAVLPLDTNPAVDDHIVNIGALAAIGLAYPQQKLSLAVRWRRLPIVKSNQWLW